MYVVSWATKWTCRGSCHGVTPVWWTNISAYKVPLLRVFLGRETFTILQEQKRKREQFEQKEVIFNMDTLYYDILKSFSYGFTEAHSAMLGFIKVKLFYHFSDWTFQCAETIHFTFLFCVKSKKWFEPLKFAVYIQVFLFVDQGMSSLCIGPECSVDTQLDAHREMLHILLHFNKLNHTHTHRNSGTESILQHLLTCSFGFPAKKGEIQFSPLGLSQGLVYTIPYITQQVWRTYTTNTPTIRVVNDVFRNMILVFCCCLPHLEQGHMSANEES